MGKGKDKVQRRRRSNTDREKVAKKNKKEEEGRKKEHKDSVDGFRALFHGFGALLEQNERVAQMRNNPRADLPPTIFELNLHQQRRQRRQKHSKPWP